MLDDPLRSLAIPFGRNRTFFPLPCHQSCQRRREIARIGSNKFVGADRGGFGTFRVVAQSEAGYAKHGRFFGNAARIGNRNVTMSLGHLPLAFSVELRLSTS